MSMTNGYGSTGTPTAMNATGMKEKIPSGYKKGVLQQFTPEQMQLFQQLFSNVGPQSFLSKLAGGDEETFNQIEGPALRQFAGLQGNLASRFSAGGGGQGALSSRRSSGFQNAAYGQASDFSQQLQAQRQGLQRQALMDLMGMSESLLGQKPYLTGLYEKQQKSPGFFQSLFSSAPKESLSALSGGIQGAIGGGMYGGIPGALMGGAGGLLKGFL